MKDKEKDPDNGNGNISKIEHEDIGPIHSGDYVRMRDAAIDSVEMSPKALFKIGYPNEFLVLTTFEHRGIKCVSLEECCEKLRNRATGQFLCTGHPEEYFQKTDPIEHRKTSERRFLALEAFGMKASVEYMEGQKKLLLKTPWTPDGISLSGGVARDIAEAAQAMGIL